MFINDFLSGTFPVILQWVTGHGYPLIFLVMVLEGPVTTAACSFAATFGYFSLPMIFFLSFMGDIVGDFIWYGVGYYGGAPMIKKFGHFFRVSPEKMEKLRAFFEKHPGKTLAVIKFSPVIPATGLIMIGASKMSIKKFLTNIAIIIIPKTILFMALGYFFGNIFNALYKYIKNGLYALAIVIMVVWIAVYVYRRFENKVTKIWERNGHPQK